MPLDYRRFNGPEDSFGYHRFTKEYLKTYAELCSDLVDGNGLRKDGRKLDEARSIFSTTGMVSQAKGSAYVEMKSTKVICSVFDPREIPHQNEFSHLGELFCEVKYAPFSCARQRKPLAPDSEEKALSVALRQALEPSVCRHLFPNYQVDIFVYILENDGGCLAAAINAAGLALADAAVPMYDLITASSAAVVGNKIFIDPSEAEEYVAVLSPEEEDMNHGVVTMSVLIELKQVTDFIQVGSMNVDCIENVLDILEKECEKIVPNIQKVLVSNIVKSIELKTKLEEKAKELDKYLDANLAEWAKKIKAS